MWYRVTVCLLDIHRVQDQNGPKNSITYWTMVHSSCVAKLGTEWKQGFRVTRLRSGLEQEPRLQLGSGTAKEPKCSMTSCSKPESHLKPRFFGWVQHAAELRYCELRTLAPNKHLSYNYITIWYICKRYSVGCCSTSRSLIGDLMNIHWVTAKNTQLSGLFHSDSMNIDPIANCRSGGERASKTGWFTYISYCDMISTQILHRSQSSAFGNMWNPAQNPRPGAVRCFNGVKPIVMVGVQFEPRPGTEPRIWISW